MNVDINCAALGPTRVSKSNWTMTKQRKLPVKAKSLRFDTLVARYYPAVYSFASRLTDDPREAVLLTHDAFNSTRQQLQSRRDEFTLVTILLNAVIRAGLLRFAALRNGS
jgi:DNA-directed RNA polymerase specialized sigma24 family protein